MSQWTLTKIQSFIDNQIEESLTLEYKAALALTNEDPHRIEISKDVSAMANSAGGIIIYGVKEYRDPKKRHLPECTDPVERKNVTKEWIEHMILGKIAPRISGIEIIPVSVNADQVLYVVEIPQSNTVHQAGDKKYYKRFNFMSVPMEDYEIREALNRQKHPEITLISRLRINSKLLPSKNYEHFYALEFSLANTGNIYANYVNYFLEIPKEILHQSVSLPDSPSIGYVFFRGENIHQDVLDTQRTPYSKTPILKYGPSRHYPLLPGLNGRTESILLVDNLNKWNYQLPWRIHADNAELKTGEIDLRELIKNPIDV